MTGCEVKYPDPSIVYPFCFCDLDQNHSVQPSHGHLFVMIGIVYKLTLIMNMLFKHWSNQIKQSINLYFTEEKSIHYFSLWLKQYISKYYEIN